MYSVVLKLNDQGGSKMEKISTNLFITLSEKTNNSKRERLDRKHVINYV